MRAFQIASRLGLWFAAAVLVVSYVAIATYTSNPWPWFVIVHESGTRTLLETVLYYDHAARELPLDATLGAAIAGGVLFVVPASAHVESLIHRRRARRLAWPLLLVVSAIALGTLWTGGWGSLYENLLQFPTRPGAPLVWGGHWRYHLLSQLALILAAFGLAGPMMLATGRSRGNRRGLVVFASSLATFLVLALMFNPGVESFADARFLGHQAREAFTHLLVSLPLGWGICLAVVRDARSRSDQGTIPLLLPVLAGVGAAVVGLFLLVASLATSAASQGQSASLTVLIFPHFFEHTFSYVVTALTAAFLIEAASAR